MPDEKRAVVLADLIRAGALSAGDVLVWPHRGADHTATVTDEGELVLDDGRSFKSPSTAAVAVGGGVRAVNGWRAWRVLNRSRKTLAEIRDEVRASL